MKFLKAQSAVESVRNVLPKPKQGGGVPVKKFHFETDLVFIRKPDFTKISKKFNETIPKLETYIVSTCEVLTGMCRLNWIQKKSQAMPYIIKHIKSMAAELGIKDLKKYSGSSDKGEVKMKEITKLLPWKFVKMGSSIEKSNQVIQKTLFKIARMRRGYRVPELLDQVEKITNNKFNSVHKKTPNELADDAKEEKEKEIVKQYNKKRKKYIPSPKTTKLKEGDFVRILLLTHGKDKGLAFKSYKGLSFSKRVYKISKATKNAVPPKFRVNRKWYIGDHLLKSEKVDEVSEELVKQREEAQRVHDELKEKEHMQKRQQKLEKLQREEEAKRKREEEERERTGKPPLRRSRRRAALEGAAARLKTDLLEKKRDREWGV
jgi:hypothetical protein